MKFFALAMSLLLMSLTSAAQNGCYPPPQGNNVWMNVFNYGDYLQLEIRNNSGQYITCDGQITWRYQSSSSDSYAGVYAYIKPYGIFTQSVSISSSLQISSARPDIRCN